MSRGKYLPDGSINPRYNPAHHKSGPRTKRGGGKGRTTKWAKADFVGWDGEGADIRGRHEYVLLANSLGEHISNPKGLSTDECLHFLMDVARRTPHAIHVGFGFGYDVNMMLRDMSYQQMLDVWQGTGKHGVSVRDYRVRYTPRKLFHLAQWREPRFVQNRDGKYKPNQDTLQLWDVFGFFQSSFVSAIEDWLGKDYPELDLIRAGKERRGTFRPGELESVILPYTQAELRALVLLMQKLHATLGEAGLPISRWDGAGAIAAAILKRERVKESRSHDLPEPLADAVQRAYFGGRIEIFQYGHHEGEVYHADLRSAYPSAMVDLPDLSQGRWSLGPERTAFSLSHVRWDFRAGNRDEDTEAQELRDQESDRYERSLYRLNRKRLWGQIRQAGYIRPSIDYPDLPASLIRYKAKVGLDVIAEDLGYDTPDALYREIERYRYPTPASPQNKTEAALSHIAGAFVGPLPWRFPEGATVYYPQHGEGWYWEPEIKAALSEAARHPEYQFKIVETWSFHPDTDHKPFGFMPALFETRKRWKREGRAAEKVLKLGYNSSYGKLVQQAGYDPETGRKPPYHELAWGGYITSLTRARLYEAAMQAEDAIIMIATDGIFSTRPLLLQESEDLGAWEVSRHAWITVVQSGVYWHSEGSWSRGFDKPDSKRSALSHEAILEGWRDGRKSMHFSSVRFVGMGSAVQSRTSFNRWRRWLDVGEWERRHGKANTPLGRELALTMAGTKRRDVEDWWRHPEDGTPAERLFRTMPNYPLWDEMSAPYELLWDREDEMIDGVPLKTFMAEKGESDV